MRRFAWVLALCALGAGADAPDAVLTGKGLVKSGLQYVLSSEKAVLDSMRELRLDRIKMDQETQNRHAIEDKVRQCKLAIGQLQYQRRLLDERLSRETDLATQNQIIGAENALIGKAKEYDDAKTQWEDKLKATGESAKESYINLTIDLGDKVEKTNHDYDAVTTDPDVKAALEKMNQTAKPAMKVAPSAEYVEAAKSVGRWRAEIASAAIQLKMDGQIPMVDVTLNGKTTRSMIVDSGASIVALTFSTAKELGMEPGANDPPLELQLADGKVVEAHQMVLKSVRVGQFTVENVDCAVLPKDLIAADDLLGGSFLKHFIYKLDPSSQELHLTMVGQAPDVKATEAPKQNEVPKQAEPPKKDANPLDPGH